MKEMNERLAELRAAAKLTQNTVAKTVGVSRAAVTQWENGLTKPKGEYIHALAKLYGCTTGYILHGEDSEIGNVTPASIGLRKIPIISYVQAGCWTESIECRSMDGSIETINTDLDLGSMAFALSVRGDSMAPEIQEGDVVVIDPDVDPLPGDIVAAKNGSHEATLKQFRPRGTNDQGQEYFELVPLNPVYPTMRSDHHHVTIIGTMMEHRRYRRRKN
jgi:SOS-response transcriptional repressor LexA